jgi:hypothetical protein
MVLLRIAIGINHVVNRVGLHRVGQGSAVGPNPGHFGAHLRLDKIGGGDGRQNSDDGHNDQQFDQRKSGTLHNTRF